MNKKQIMAAFCVGLGMGCIGGTLMNFYLALGVGVVGLVTATVLTRKKIPVLQGEIAPTQIIKQMSEEEQFMEIGFRALELFNHSKKTIKSLAMRQSLADIAENTDGILQYAQKHPTIVLSIKKFFTYYLVEVEDMIHTYVQLSQKPVIDKMDYQVLTKIEQTIGSAKTAIGKYHKQIKTDNTMDLEVQLEVFERETKLDGVIQK